MAAELGSDHNRIHDAPTGKLRLHPRADEVPPITPDQYDALLEEIEHRGIVVPLDVLPLKRADGREAIGPDDADEIVVLDGRHRLAAARALGIETVPIREVDTTCWHGDDDNRFGLDECESHCFEYIVKAPTMRRHLAVAERMKLAAKIIITDPERSDRQVAKATGLSHPTVARVRDGLEAEGQVERVATSTGGDGKRARLGLTLLESNFQNASIRRVARIAIIRWRRRCGA